MSLAVLVTGGGGYLGSMLCLELLAAGHRVTVIDNGSGAGSGLLSLLSMPGFTLTLGDVRSPGTVKRVAQNIDVVVHLAAIVGQPACDADPIGATSVNLDGVEIVAESVPDGKLLIFASSSSVYGKALVDFCDEKTTPNPLSLYSELKLKAEEIVLTRPESLVVRPVTLYGSSGSMRYDLLPHQMVREGLDGGVIAVYEPERLRSFLHVRDASRSLSHLAECDPFGIAGLRPSERVVNLADPMSHISKGDLGAMIAGILRCCVDVRTGYEDPDERDYRVVSSSQLSPKLARPMALGMGLREVATVLRFTKSISSAPKVR